MKCVGRRLPKDGHPIKGTIVIIVKPAAATETSTQKPGEWNSGR